MSGRHGLIASVVGILLAGSGCVSCGGNGYGAARQAGPDCEALTCQRNQVYVFAMCGVNPLEMIALDTFRDQLNAKGYSKVATGQIVHAIWMASEIKRIRTEEPNAAIVIVGVEGGASTAVRLAEKVGANGSAVAGVVVFDRRGGNRSTTNGQRFLTIANHAISADESVALVADLLNEVAHTTVQPAVVEMTSWDYEFAPEPRPLTDPGHNPEWAFLFDDSIPMKLGTSLVPAVAATSKPQMNATASHR